MCIRDRSNITAAWNWFEKNELIEKNIAKGLELPKIEMGEIGILTVEETERLFRANEKIDPEVCGLMALDVYKRQIIFFFFWRLDNCIYCALLEQNTAGKHIGSNYRHI